DHRGQAGHVAAEPVGRLRERQQIGEAVDGLLGQDLPHALTGEAVARADGAERVALAAQEGDIAVAGGRGFHGSGSSPFARSSVGVEYHQEQRTSRYRRAGTLPPSVRTANRATS